VDAGEKFDLLIMPTPALAALDTDGKLGGWYQESARPRGHLGLPSARAGTPKPDIHYTRCAAQDGFSPNKK